MKKNKPIISMIFFVLFISFATTGLSDESTRQGRPEFVPGEILVKFKAGVVKNRKSHLFFRVHNKKLNELEQI